MEVVPLLLLVLGLFVAVRTLSVVHARRTAVRRPHVRLLPRPASPARAVPRALGPRARARAENQERRAA